MTTNRRPLAAKNIAELEALHAACNGDLAVLGSIREELAHRSTERARKLRERIDLPTSPQASQQRAAAPVRTPSPAPLKSRQTSRSAPLATPNEPRSILCAWTALEALSPQTFRRPENLANDDPRCVAPLQDRLPWTLNERSRPDRQLYYQVVLGAVRVDGAMQRLIQAFGADEERTDRAREKAVLAGVLVDRNGCLLPEKSIGISSFGWALPLALELRLGELGDWPDVERRTIEKLEEMLRRVDENGRPLPLDAELIDRTFRWLVEAMPPGTR